MVVLPNIRRKYMESRLPAGVTVQMSDCVVTLANDSRPYTGAAQTVGVSVTWEGKALAVNADYTLTFANNVEIGPATVTVTGMGQFEGSVTKTFYITSAEVVPTEWDELDLSAFASTPTASAKLMDGEIELQPYHLQPIDDTRLFFSHNDENYNSSNAKTSMYIWNFEAGHPFEVAHLAGDPASRSVAENRFKWAAMAADGKTVAYSTGYYGKFWTRTLSTAFDLATLGAEAEQTLAAGNPLVFLAKGGARFVLKSSGTMYVYSCAAPFSYASPTLDGTYSMSNYNDAVKAAAGVSGTVSWKDFQFDDGGSILVASLAVGSAEVVAKIVFSTAWQLDTGTVDSVFLPSGASTVRALALNAAGSKLLLFSRGDNKLYEYSISQ